MSYDTKNNTNNTNNYKQLQTKNLSKNILFYVNLKLSFSNLVILLNQVVHGIGNQHSESSP